MTVSLASLADCRSLADLTPPARLALGEAARLVEFRPEERLIPWGEHPQRLLILVQGLAKLVGVTVNGHERILSIYRAHDMVGPSVLMHCSENQHDVMAMSHVQALAISRRDLFILCRSHPSLLLALNQEVSRQLAAMTMRVMTVASQEVPVRLSQLLLEFADGNGSRRDAFVPLAYRLTHETMAQMVGASRPHTSTVLRDLESHGAVQRRTSSGLMVRPLRLRQIVENGCFSKPAPTGSLALSA